MTTGKSYEQPVAKVVPFGKDDVVAFDRGYSNFSWCATLDAKGGCFVTLANITPLLESSNDGTSVIFLISWRIKLLSSGFSFLPS